MKKMKYIATPQFIIFFLTALAAGVMWISSVKDAKIKDEINLGVKKLDEKSKEVKEEVDNLLKTSKEANQQLEKNYQKIKQNLEETIKVQNEAIRIHEETIGTLTGGDSWPQILEASKNGFYIKVNGKYSIPNCRIEIYYLRDYLETPTQIPYSASIIESKQIEKIEEVSYHKLFVNDKGIFIPWKKELREEFVKSNSAGFDIFFTSDYRRWKQCIRFIRHQNDRNKWDAIYTLIEEELTKVERGFSSKEKYIKVSHGFPITLKKEGVPNMYNIVLYNIDINSLYNPNRIVPESEVEIDLPVYVTSDFVEDNNQLDSESSSE